MRRKSVALLSATLLAATLAGCGSNAGSGGDQSVAAGSTNDTIANAANVGMDVCANCHTGQVNQWMLGRHANLNGSTATGTVNTNGRPSIGIAGSSTSDGLLCTQCHDQLGDSQNLIAEYTGNIPRPVISCESCHGGGQFHFGTGPLPYAKPDFERCGQCHNGDVPSSATSSSHTLETDNIVEDYRNSAHKHARKHGDKGELNAEGDGVDTRAVCSRCHTDEGVKEFITVNGGYAVIEAALGDLDPILNSSDVQCRTCHNGHTPEKLLKDAGNTTLFSGDATFEVTVAASSEYQTCITCHQTMDGYHGENNPRPKFTRVLYDTHIDNPATPDIEGYVIKATDDRACRDCHNPHSADTTINNQWAESGHAGNLKEIKDASEADADPATTPLTAAVTGDDAGAFASRNFATGSDACKRCHTATGAKALMDSRASLADTDAANDVVYNPATLDFSHLNGEQKEMIYCWTCHTNNVGSLRNPAQITEIYNDDNTSTALVDGVGPGTIGDIANELVQVTFPDVSGSNVCLSCHVGRETGDVIKVSYSNQTVNNRTDIPNDGTAEDGVRGFINSHYLTAGIQLFGVGGFEYDTLEPTLSYEDVTFFQHDEIGTEAQPGTGTNGPCVGCHMSADESHIFLPVKADHDTGLITEVTANVCIECHADNAGNPTTTPESLNTSKAQYESSLEALRLALEAKGIFFAESHPYFFRDSNNNGILDDTEKVSSNAFTNWGGVNPASSTDPFHWRNVMGAAFNFNLLAHDPGGYAHNRFYIKALIWDSIDFIDNGIIDSSTATTIATLPLTATDLANAQAYLGDSRPGDGSRPALLP